MKQIKLGYEVKTAKEVSIKPSHLICTGITQLSGKTTTLEALIKRSGLKAIVFKTKIGEKGFTEGIDTPPFFRDRSDYEFVKSLIEAYAKEKLVIEKGTLMRLCKGSASLINIKKRIDDALAEGKLRGLKEEIHTRLQHYLENLIPQIQYAHLSNTLDIKEGINIMNLERFTEEAQSLIIQAVATEVLKTQKDTIIVIPEAWKFIPQKYNNPCKRAVESFIRQGATNNNYIWIDSQDMAGVDKLPLKQISTWILGYQAERNEVKHTLDQISLPKKMKPKEDEIMTLKKGHFYLSSYDGVVKVYVQPHWLEDEQAVKIAKGEIDVETIEKPESLTPYQRVFQCEQSQPKAPSIDEAKIKKDIIELRTDFFDKIQEIQNALNKIYSEIYMLKTSKTRFSEDEIISKILQKINIPQNSGNIDKEHVINEVLTRIPKQAGTTVYEVAPLDKIKKDFLEEAKSKIMSDISTLNNEQKKILKFVETQGKGCSQTQICSKCLYVSATSGSTRSRVSNACKGMANLELVRMDKNAVAYPNLKQRIEALLGIHEAKPEEIEQVYNHILAEMLK